MVFQLSNGQTVGANGKVASTWSGSPGPAANSGGSPQLGSPRTLTVAVKVDGATTTTFQVSYDGVNFVDACIADTATKASITFAGAGAQAINITPAPFVQVTNGSSSKLWFWVYTS